MLATQDYTIDTLEKLLKEKFGDELNLKVTSKSSPLYSIIGTSDYEIKLENLEGEILDNINSSLLMTGLVDLKFSVTEGKSSRTEPDISTTSQSFDEWFVKLTENTILIPDTNTILNRTITSLSYISSFSILDNTVIQIPRLAILEMERKANESKDKKLLQKRKTFLGYVELMELKNHGAEPMRELDRETLFDFSNISGTANTDVLIRREIKDAKRRDREIEIDNAYTLITSDMVNSLSAIAEGIDTIYISKIPDWNKKIRKGDLSQITKFLITSAVLSEKISINSSSGNFEILGMWDGKNNTDWFEQRVLLTNSN